ncbi:MAG: hypothetical protein ACTHL8_18220 [Burkholderiaceae bacterium]
MSAQIISNRISLDIPAGEMQAIQDAIKVLQDKLQPHLVDLGPTDRRTMPRMGAKTVDFVSKTLGSATAHPQIVPGFVDLAEFSRDLAAVGTLRALLQPLQQLADLVGDSLALSGSEAYTAALACYQSFKAASKLGVPGMTTIADDLAERFPGRPSRAGSQAASTGGDASPADGPA